MSTIKFLPLAVFLVSFLAAAPARASAAFTPDAQGYIRHWLMLAPVPLGDEEPGTEAIYKQQVRGEASLRPKAGDSVKVGNKDLTWQKVTATTNYFDFNAILKSINDRAAGYMVTYIESETERPDVIMTVASNDEGRIYFNGVDIYLFGEPRQLVLDSDKGKVTLKKGLNVIVFKVVNEQNAWQGSLRLLDKSGLPLHGIKVKLAP